MGVLSKALRYSVIAATISGCAGSPTSIAPEGDTADTMAADTVAADTVAADTAAGLQPGFEQGGEVTTVVTETASAAPDYVVDEASKMRTLVQQAPVSVSKDLMKSSAASGPIAIFMEGGEGFRRFAVDTGSTAPSTFDTLHLESPSRLVLDLTGVAGPKSPKQVALNDDRYLRGVRVASGADKTRVVFDMLETTPGMQHYVEQVDGKVMVTLFTPTTFSNTAAYSIPTPAEMSSVEPALEAPAETVAAIEPEPTPSQAIIANKDEDKHDEDHKHEGTHAADTAVGELALESVEFRKTAESAGQVKLALSEEAAFEMKQTAPSEYVLSIPGAVASEDATLPRVSPKGFPGVRSVRATSENGITMVRMFIDPGVDLIAKPEGKNILISARPAMAAASADARAQLTPKGEAADGQAEAKPNVQSDEAARKNPTGEILSDDGSKVYRGRLISLDLQDTDIDNALRIIAEVSNLNIIASQDVVGKVTLRLIDVPWDQALDVILKTNGLDQVTEGNVIRIAPVDKLRQEREAQLANAKAKEQLEQLSVGYYRVSYARATDIKEQVESVLSERGSIATDERTNQIIVKDILKGQDSAKELLRKLDLRTPQVLLETQIVEGQRSILRDLGFQWNFSFIKSPQIGNATGLVFPNAINVGGTAGDGNLVNFPATLDRGGSAISAVLDSADGSRSLATRLSALETEGKLRTISRPQVATVNNKRAEIKSVEKVRVRLPNAGTAIATGAGAAAAGAAQAAFQEIPIGIELQVTPQASPDSYVLLDVQARSSTFGNRAPIDGIPTTVEREATSTILVKSAQTFALGGVYRLNDQDDVQGVPFLKDIPFLGALFRRTFTSKGDEELIFFITPHIVEGSFDAGLMIAESQK